MNFTETQQGHADEKCTYIAGINKGNELTEENMESENSQGKSLISSLENRDENEKMSGIAGSPEDSRENSRGNSYERTDEDNSQEGIKQENSLMSINDYNSRENSLMSIQRKYYSDGHENDTRNSHSKKSAPKKFQHFVLILLFIAIAAIVGIQAGNLIYSIDSGMIHGIDVQNFKNTINSSMPIIDTVYNSGKSSVSLSREIKSLFSKIFTFDITSPMTILNVQSPIFKSYYDHSYKSMLGMNGNADADGKGTSVTDQGNTAQKDGDPNSTGNGKQNNDISQNGTGSGDNSTGDGDGQTGGGNAPGGKDNIGQNDASAQNSTVLTDPQPISSITFEEEEENEDDSNLVALDKMVIKNFTKYDIDIAALLKEPIEFDFSKKGPKVLIYHTHTSESYVLKESDLGKKDVPSFNSDPQYNVVRVGEELARNLKKYGIETLHNGTVHDTVRSAAYGESIKTLQSYVKSYPSINVYIDIHRDAAGSDSKYRAVTEINGKNAAQIMFVMGSDEMLPNPHWKENLKFALKVQQKLNEKYPGLARPLWIVGKRYNQQISDKAVLIEVGGDGNLLSECLESTKYLAEALSDVMLGK